MYLVCQCCIEKKTRSAFYAHIAGNYTRLHLILKSGWSHTNLLWSERYAHLLRPIHSQICSGWLRGVLYTYIYWSDILTGMTRPRPFTAHARRGSDNNAFSTRLYGKYFAEEHTFFQAWTTILYLFYWSTDSSGGAVISFLLATTRRTWPNVHIGSIY